MIKFIIDEKEIKEELTLEDVEEDHFFVDDLGRLCQKVSEISYNTITNQVGTPLAHATEICTRCMSIKRILPKVTRIEF